MKKVLLTIITMLLPMLACADAVEINGIWYNLVKKAQEAEVAQSPNYNYSEFVNIPASIDYEGTTYNVTSIGANAFRFCNDVTSIDIPESVISIGTHAFVGCSSLASVSIPNSVTSIGTYAFLNCIALSSVSLPNSLKTVGNSLFQGCSKLSSVTLSNTMTSISDHAFRDCISLKTINIPSSVTSIGTNAFLNCSSLTSVTIPNNVTNIGSSAFYNCSGLKTVIIGNGMETIGDQAFAKCSDLTDVFCSVEKLSKSDAWNHEGLYTYQDAFKESYPQYMTLHVPAASIETYRLMTPWSQFKTFVSLKDSDTPTYQKCANPEISYVDGKLIFTSDTEGADYIVKINDPDIKTHYSNEIQLQQKYIISVYATKPGYDDSDIVIREIIITENGKSSLFGDVDGNGVVNVADHVKLTDIIMNQGN